MPQASTTPARNILFSRSTDGIFSTPKNLSSPNAYFAQMAVDLSGNIVLSVKLSVNQVQRGAK